MNQKIRKINKKIEVDPLWKGRFFLKQEFSDYHKYSDSSGAFLTVGILFIDKKTHIVEPFLFEDSGVWKEFDLWKGLNYFIIDTCKVWEENPKPNLNSPSYVDTPVDFL